MNLERLAASALACLMLAACGTERPDSADPSPGADSPRSALVRAGEISVPPGAAPEETALARVDDLSYDALVFSVASAINGDGIFASGTVTAIDTEIDELGVELAVSTVRLDEVWVGDASLADVRIVSGVDDLALVVGESYLFSIGPSEGDYSFIGGMLFDRAGLGWRLRPSEVEHPPEPVELADGDIAGVLADADDFLAEREAARSVDIELAATQQGAGASARSSQGPSKVTIAVSGHLPGEPMEFVFCDISDPSFSPTDFASCDYSTWVRTIPEAPGFEIEVTFPTHLDLGLEEPVSCATARCALVVSDAGWLGEVWEAYEL